VSMKTEQTFIPLMWMRRGLLLVGLFSLTGCDYWPPTLQNQIEGLLAELNDALDDRQRLDQELTERRVEQASLQREVEEKARENEVLQQRLAAASRTSDRESPARHDTPVMAGIETKRAASHADVPPRPSIQQGSYVSLLLEQPHHRGPHVERLQRLLRRHELPIRVDGIYGRTTEAAVRSFQRVHGLPTDGIVGPVTYRTLLRPAPTSRSVRQLRLQRPPLQGRDIVNIQRALRHAGHRILIDGHYGPETDIAVTRFQRKHGLEPDGMVGPQTWAALRTLR